MRPGFASRYLSLAIYALTFGLGGLAYVMPFLSVAQRQSLAGGLQDSPLWLGLLTVLCVAALLVEMQGQAISAKTVALLGILVAINSVLRFLEVSFPGPGGFSPIFPLVILSGFVFGPRFGFLMGAFTLLASAMITAGVGPWLPYQMLTTGWIGLSAGLIGRVTGPYSALKRKGWVLGLLIALGALWGMVYGVIMNLWFWPFLVGAANQSWQPGMGIATALKNYFTFYLASSAWWDFFAALGNALLIALVGLPTLQALERFRLKLGIGGQPAAGSPPSLDPQLLAFNPQPSTIPTGPVQPSISTLHPLAWLMWLGAALVVVSSARNPFYLIELFLVGLVISRSAGKSSLSPSARFGFFIIVFSTLFNGLSSHFGQTVLFRLPQVLPLVGGAITLEALAYGAITGLALTTMLTLFVVFNQVIPAHQLVRLTPRAFHQAGVTLSIALTYLPATRRSLDQIREAQAVRGHQLRSWRDWLPLWLPLLISGLERAFQLAEAMVARGFGAVADRPASIWMRFGLALSLLAVLLGQMLVAFQRATAMATPLVAGGVVLLGASLWLAGRRVPFTPYRSHRWGKAESLILGGALLAIVLVVWPGVGMLCDDGRLLCPGSTFYSPYPRLAWPAFDPLIGLGLLGLLVPATRASQLADEL